MVELGNVGESFIRSNLFVYICCFQVCLEIMRVVQVMLLMCSFIMEHVHTSAEKILLLWKVLRESKTNHDLNHHSLPMLVSTAFQPL